MDKSSLSAPTTLPRVGGSSARRFNGERWARLYARVALATAFLSAVASRFGLWDKTFDLKHFTNFIHFTAQVLSFMPLSIIPLLAWTATAAETTLGILLIAGLWTRWVAIAAAILLAIFGTSMAISLGLESPMDYSVFSASSASLLLAVYQSRKPEANS
jgi:uncharacterized membrane protein YphA (DoxX/SURF4 family)